MTATTARPSHARDGHAPAGRLPRVLRGPEGQPAWVRPSVLALLVFTAVFYVWDLGASGWSNSFYAAAVQSGTMSWKALLFGSLDPANSITVDKPPASMWVMALSGRIFGFSSWSMLVPQALEGVASVGLLYAAVKRQAGPYAGLLAGGILALTPVAALMFRFNNPDALLVLLMVLAAYAVVRGLEAGRTGWFVLAGSAIGFAFLTKMLQAFLVVPALALVVLVAAPGSWWRRIGQLLAAGGALVVSAGWYIALAELWPASSRPYIGGSTDNSLLQLTLGYNGLERISGGGGPGAGGGPGGGGGNGMFGGATGLTRMFGDSFGSQISWLLPAALIALVAGLVLTFMRRVTANSAPYAHPVAEGRPPRTDPVRAGLILWGGWLLVTMLVFSFMSGTIHPYYTVALAPGIAGVVAIGGRELWRRHETIAGRAVLAVMSAATGIWAFVLLGRADWHPELRYIVLVLCVLAAVALLIPARLWKRAALTGLIVAILGGLTAPAAYAFDTVATPQTGSMPTAGPSSANGMGGFPGGGKMPNGGKLPNGGKIPGGGQRPGGGQMPGQGQNKSQGQRQGGGPGAETANSALVAALKKTSTTWAAATIGSQSSASLQLGSDKAVMAIGGFTGSDASPTLAQFKQYVSEGKITYFVPGGMGGMGGGPGQTQNGKSQNSENAQQNRRGGGGFGQSGTGNQITTWVKANFKSTTIGGTTVYDLTQPKS